MTENYNPPPIITLISSLRDVGGYLAMIKGAIYKSLPQANIVDINNSIHYLSEIAYLVIATHDWFPDGTIHLVITQGIKSTRLICLQVEHIGYFVGPDNGVFTFLFDKYPFTAREYLITSQEQFSSYGFFAAQELPQIVVKLAQKRTPNRFGQLVENFEMIGPLIDASELVRLPELQAVRKETLKKTSRILEIEGKVIYIDSLTTLCITNIPLSFFEGISDQQLERAEIKTYSSDTILGAKIAAYFGSSGFLEIAYNNSPLGTKIKIKLEQP